MGFDGDLKREITHLFVITDFILLAKPENTDKKWFKLLLDISLRCGMEQIEVYLKGCCERVRRKLSDALRARYVELGMPSTVFADNGFVWIDWILVSAVTPEILARVEGLDSSSCARKEIIDRVVEFVHSFRK
jgi:hypothetical protein